MKSETRLASYFRVTHVWVGYRPTRLYMSYQTIFLRQLINLSYAPTRAFSVANHLDGHILLLNVNTLRIKADTFSLAPLEDKGATRAICEWVLPVDGGGVGFGTMVRPCAPFHMEAWETRARNSIYVHVL